MIMTLADAATHLGLTQDDLHDWRANGWLNAVEHPCLPNVWLVEERHLCEVDAALYQGHAPGRRRLPAMTARDLPAWLNQHTRGRRPVTYQAILDWIRDGDLTRTDPGGRGHTALFDPHRALAVHAARTRRLPVAPTTDTRMPLPRNGPDLLTSVPSAVSGVPMESAGGA